MHSIPNADRKRLRSLAKTWMEIALSDGMAERKRLWKALKDLEPIRPMIHFETCSVEGYVSSKDIICSDGFLRNVERLMLLSLRQYELLNDDIVLEPYFQLAAKVINRDYGVSIQQINAHDSMGYRFKSAIESPGDLDKLRPRVFAADLEPVLKLKEMLLDIFGDIMPVRMGNVEILTPDEVGYNPLVGINSIGISGDVFRLLGGEAMLFWMYDHPDALKRLISYLRDDRVRYYDWLESAGLMDYNANGWNTSASSYGFCSDLPSEGEAPAKMGDCWVWAESQESVTLSPEMFDEFYLKAIAHVANRFGLVYYACCEPIQDRFDYIKKAIPNLRAVSVSAWNDAQKAAEAIGKGYVYSCKPNPSLISGKTPNWKGAKEDIRKTFSVARDLPLEFIIRDVYDVGGDYARLAQYVNMIREICGI